MSAARRLHQNWLNSDFKIYWSSVQNEDQYYFNEEGLMVFTEAYHLKRGSCCGNGCKHCPYLPKHQTGSTQVAIDVKKNENKKPE
jgi:hypothetical protein